MKYANKLLKVIEKYIGSKKTLAFIEEYELIFNGDKSPIEKEVSKEIFELFDDISVDIAYFEPNLKLKSDYKGYLNENSLFTKVKTNYTKLKELLK